MLILIFFKEIFRAIEGVTTSILDSVGWAALKPLTPFFTWINSWTTLDSKVKGIEFEVLTGFDKDYTFDTGATVVELFLGLYVDLEFFILGVSVSHLYFITIPYSKYWILIYFVTFIFTQGKDGKFKNGFNFWGNGISAHNIILARQWRPFSVWKNLKNQRSRNRQVRLRRAVLLRLNLRRLLRMFRVKSYPSACWPRFMKLLGILKARTPRIFKRVIYQECSKILRKDPLMTWWEVTGSPLSSVDRSMRGISWVLVRKFWRKLLRGLVDHQRPSSEI